MTPSTAPAAPISAVLATLSARLLDPASSLPLKYRVLYSLRNVQGEEARRILAAGLGDPSALLRHEIAYCLGQRQEPASTRLLTTILANTAEDSMVRHEAAEALGAIGTDKCECTLRQYEDDEVLEVAETCQLALQRIERCRNGSVCQEGASPYLSVDPMLAAPASTPTAQLQSDLMDESAPIADRYAAMFALRNCGSNDAVDALGAAFGARSALLKHEVAYVLGQMQHPGALEVLRGVLENPREHAMVRHEAAEALGSIATPPCIALLEAFVNDTDPIVAHSCEVALDMLLHQQSGAFEYADMGEITHSQDSQEPHPAITRSELDQVMVSA